MIADLLAFGTLLIVGLARVWRRTRTAVVTLVGTGARRGAAAADAVAASVRIVPGTVTAWSTVVWVRAVGPLWHRVRGVVEQSMWDAGAWLVHTFPPLAARSAARLTRRFVRWLPRACWRTLVYAAIGAGLMARHTGRYCVGYQDFAARIEHAEHDGRPERAARLRRRWRATALRRTVIVLLIMTAATWSVSVAVSVHGAGVAWSVLVALAAVSAAVGRAVRPPRPPAERDHTMAEATDGAPFPMADAHTRAEAADATTRALAAEGIDLRATGEVRRTRWGWEVGVMLRRGTPALITAKTAELETHLDLPAGGMLVTPDRARRAHVTLRFTETDPFAVAPAAPSRPPHSATITERAVIGTRIDGQPLEVPLLGVHGVVIGSPGAGKSTTLAAIGDAVTACSDAVVWDLDPGGLGLAPLATAVGRREQQRAEIEEALADALALAEARPRLLGGHGMGDAWQPSSARPAVVVIVDEYPRLSDRAKELAVALLRIGRKARVTLILAATEATSDALGASIAELAGLKILHSCRSTDVRLVLGSTMAAEGWRPDRLHPATADDPGDAGKCYVSTAGQREPLIAKVHRHDAGALSDRSAERAVAGTTAVDPESWNAARALRMAERGRSESSSKEGGRPDRARQLDHQAITDILTVFGADHRLWTEEIRTRLADHDQDVYGRWTAETIASTLRPLGVSAGQIKRGGVNRNGYDCDVIAAAYRDRLGRP